MAGSEGKILVIRGGAIGDFILTLPAIAAIRETFPDVQLDLLGYPQLAEIAKASKVIDAYRSIEARSLAGFFARNGKLDPELSAYFEGVNLIVSYLYDPDDFFKQNVGRTTKAQFLQGPHRPDEAGSIHATDVFLRPLERLAIYNADPTPRLKIIPQRPWGEETYVAVHPGSGSEKKNWPIERWTKFLELVAERAPYKVLVVGGEADYERMKILQARIKSDKLRFLENVPLLQTASALSGARAFVGHDSGISHLAAALSVPVLALWGPSNQEIWKPRSELARTLTHRDGLPALVEEIVFTQLEFLVRSLPST